MRDSDRSAPGSCAASVCGAGRRPRHRHRGGRRSIGTCAAPTCDGTPRVVDETSPSTAFPTFGGAAGGFEVLIAEGFAHLDVVAAEDDAGNPVVSALADFIARNLRAGP